MTAYWGIRTSKGKWDLINAHFAQGVLRQGWGDVNLREIGRLVDSGDADHEQVKTWRYTKKMLDIEPGDMSLHRTSPAGARTGFGKSWRAMSSTRCRTSGTGSTPTSDMCSPWSRSA